MEEIFQLDHWGQSIDGWGEAMKGRSVSCYILQITLNGCVSLGIDCSQACSRGLKSTQELKEVIPANLDDIMASNLNHRSDLNTEQSRVT